MFIVTIMNENDNLLSIVLTASLPVIAVVLYGKLIVFVIDTL